MRLLTAPDGVFGRPSRVSAPIARRARPPSRCRGRDHGSATYAGTSFHDGGEDAYADLMTLIDGARRSIHIETYVLKADETGNAILERLIARSKEGIEVRLLLDGFGSFHMQRRPLRKLRRAGGKVAFFLPIWRLTLLNRSRRVDRAAGLTAAVSERPARPLSLARLQAQHWQPIRQQPPTCAYSAWVCVPWHVQVTEEVDSRLPMQGSMSAGRTSRKMHHSR
jgi:PLD-like domain